MEMLVWKNYAYCRGGSVHSEIQGFHDIECLGIGNLNAKENNIEKRSGVGHDFEIEENRR